MPVHPGHALSKGLARLDVLAGFPVGHRQEETMLMVSVPHLVGFFERQGRVLEVAVVKQGDAQLAPVIRLF